MTKSMHSSKRKGFTLIEALIAAGVLALGLFAVGLAIYAEFPFINQNREKTIATLAAQEEIETIRGKPFDEILALSSSFTASGFEYLKNPVGTVTVDNIYNESDIRRVSVTVTWDSSTGRTLHKSLTTLMTRNGINKQ
jgi:Tfp pilus assembly protein PilV